MARRLQSDWVATTADKVVAEADRRAPGRRIVVASGLSPLGTIHLGSQREVMVPHLVADEIKRRGIDCEHILSWDDYDIFRKVPAGVDPSFAQHIGKPQTSVPDPCGAHASWSDHFKEPLRVAMDALGVEVREISQTREYTSGAYRAQILFAMRQRELIDGILSEYRTKSRDSTTAPDERAEYYPYKPYCAACLRDLTTITSYESDSGDLSYTCACGHAESVRLGTHDQGKLVWKVDWPMRWAHEGVVFESAVVDHSSPGSSFDASTRIMREVYGAEPPLLLPYAPSGIAGMAKLSSSKGGMPTAADALRIMEPQMLRWLYTRRQPSQPFTIAFGQELGRTYDEWDALERKVAAGTAPPLDAAVHMRATTTAAGQLPRTPVTSPFRTLASVLDITAGSDEQTLRVLREVLPESGLSSLDDVQPRLDHARQWNVAHVPQEQRTRVRQEPDHAALEQLDDEARASLKLLLDGLDSNWSFPELTDLLYAVPKIQSGLDPDAEPTAELKFAQRSFFTLLYRLLVDADTGPRLPTLLLALGAGRVRTLLTGT